MPVRLSVAIDAKRTRRYLRFVGPKAVAFATKKTLDDAGELLRRDLQRSWLKAMKRARRRNFPKVVLRLNRSRVVPRVNITIPAVIVSIAADEILETQQRGGVRRSKSGKRMFVPAPGRRSKKIPPTAYRIGNALFTGKRNKKYVGALVDKVVLKSGNWDIKPSIYRTRRALPRLMRRAIVRELRRASARSR